MVPLKTEKGEAAAKDIIEAQDTGQGAHVYHSRYLTEPAREHCFSDVETQFRDSR